jgi:hypothetical protein
LKQASRTPFDGQAIWSSPSRKDFLTVRRFAERPSLYAAMDIPPAANCSPRRSTARAIRASLLAKATTTTLRWARLMRPFAHRPSGVSRSTMLKIYVYGYVNQIQSSRRLERETARNVEMMWLTGQLTPDFKTIADFRKDNGPAGVRFVPVPA